MTEPEQVAPLPPEDSSPVPAEPAPRRPDQVNGPSSTIGIGTGLGLGCLVLVVLFVVFGFVARSAGWL
ncbi:MAG: hypothetical protein KC442_06970 [Thermomicrobiales bacterium]|nr:hypothetical protein [Thermomicrobiales bacterium]